MTEQERRKITVRVKNNKYLTRPETDYIVDALEEVEQYRAIGTVSELQDLVIGINALADSQFSAADMAKLVNDMKSLYEYQQIGTPKECREAVEKQIAKKPQKVLLSHGIGYECKQCGNELSVNAFNGEYCHWCGQKLDWSDE